jgi:hypothetical protein
MVRAPLPEIGRPHGVPVSEWILCMSDDAWHGTEGTAIIRECARQSVPNGHTREGAIRHFAVAEALPAGDLRPF